MILPDGSGIPLTLTLSPAGRGDAFAEPCLLSPLPLAGGAGGG